MKSDRVAELETMLKTVLDFCRNPYDANDSFERVGAMYQQETGYLRPGKSDMLYDTSCAENVLRFSTWANTKWKDLYDEAQAMLAQGTVTQMKNALLECEEYFDNRADVDYTGDELVGNIEMRMLGTVRRALGKE